MLVVREFLTAAECSELTSISLLISRPMPVANQPLKLVGSIATNWALLSVEQQRLLQTIERRIGAVLDTPPHAGEMSLVFNNTMPYESREAEPALVDQGLHVDTQNQRPRRFFTAIIYLNSLDEAAGGATVFPLAVPLSTGSSSEPAHEQQASEEAAVAAAHGLVRRGVTHSQSPKVAGHHDNEAAVELMEHAVRTRQGVRVQPTQGLCALFFSRCDDGHIDPRSWHAGMNVLGQHSFKITLQKFKEVPALPDEENELQQLLQQHDSSGNGNDDNVYDSVVAPSFAAYVRERRQRVLARAIDS